MCRGRKVCQYLGTNPALWSKTCPLPPPIHFANAYKNILKIEYFLADKRISEAINILCEPLGDEIREWFIEHAQSAWSFRSKVFGNLEATLFLGSLDTKKLTNDFKNQVIERDGYVCGYCKGKLVSDERLNRISSIVGAENFRISGNNSQRHGYIYIVRTTVDHVLPQSKGGQTELDNLITCCWACNYGKAEKTLGEIGLVDPRVN
jgi:5-methylcytosine-specific restriction endonuclease McrA